MTEGRFPVTVTTLQWWEFLSYKTMLFLRLFQRVILAKLFKASMACKQYSAVFLSLRINEDKNPCQGEMPRSASCVPNAKSEGERCKRRQQQQQQMFFGYCFSRGFSERCALPTSCGCAKGLGGHTNPPAHLLSSGHFWACQACKYQKVLSISHRWGCEGWKGNVHTQRTERALQPQLWFWSDTSVKHRKSCSYPTGPQQYQGPCRGADPAFGSLRGSKEPQAGLVGSGCGHDLAMARQKATLR